jgi:hypothetical protein
MQRHIMTVYDKHLASLLGIDIEPGFTLDGSGPSDAFEPCGPDCACAEEAAAETDTAGNAQLFGLESLVASTLGLIADLQAAQAAAADKRQLRIEAVAALSRTMENVSEGSLIMARLIEQVVVNPQD